MNEDHARPTRPTSAPGPTWLDARTAAVSVALALLLIALAAWRTSDEPADPPGTRADTAVRTFGDVAVEAPAAWHVLDRTSRHVTWGSADRSHTVTLASTEASSVALPLVVREVMSGSARSIPGSRAMGAPVELELDRAPRGDSAMLAEFVVAPRADRRLAVTQVWRRDVRAGLDIVATWTSADGSWPISPRAAIPHSTGSR